MVLIVTKCSTLFGARQALFGVTVFPATLKTLSDFELAAGKSKDYPGHVGEKGELGFMHLPPK